MKKFIYLIVVIGALALIVAGCGLLTVPPAEQSVADDKVKPECTTIQNGVLTYSTGHYLEDEPLIADYDIFGYNYQAHMFNGSYANSYLGRDGFPPYEGDDEAYLADYPDAEFKWYWPYRDVQLMMKWSDAWLSNKDCNDDGKLDRGYGCEPVDANSSACEGAWLTNHQWGEYEDNGETCEWDYFVKIVYPPGGPVDEDVDGYDDNTGGSILWTSFVRIQQVSNDPCVGEYGNIFAVEPAGFGAYK